MDTILFAVIIGQLLCMAYLLLRRYSEHKRILEMIEIVDSITKGQKKRKIFSKKSDEIGRLAFEINKLSDLYGTSQAKFEKERHAKKRLISNLSHDIRTPLVSVIGYLEAIVQKRISEEQKNDYINTAYDKAILLKEHVNQLFEFVQSDENEIVLSMEKVDVCEVTKQVMIDIIPFVENDNIQLESSVPDEELCAVLDKEGFVRILQNLIKNSLVHGGKGQYLGIFVHKELSTICIDIVDKGQGIEAQHLPYIFERLYKADKSRLRGGGIGLAIAKELKWVAT